MAIVINGSGTVTGLAVGGLPDGTVDAGTLATDSVVTGKIADGTIANADIADLAASKLTGALPAISGASLTGITTGKVLQVVTSGTNSSGTASPGNAVNIGSYTITPSATSSKIVIIAYFRWEGSGIQGGINISTASTSGAIEGTQELWLTNQNNFERGDSCITCTHSPSTTSAKTYYAYVATHSNGSVSTTGILENMILMEIAG
jgi:hypothetical protein